MIRFQIIKYSSKIDNCEKISVPIFFELIEGQKYLFVNEFNKTKFFSESFTFFFLLFISSLFITYFSSFKIALGFRVSIFVLILYYNFLVIYRRYIINKNGEEVIGEIVNVSKDEGGIDESDIYYYKIRYKLKSNQEWHYKKFPYILGEGDLIIGKKIKMLISKKQKNLILTRKLHLFELIPILILFFYCLALFTVK